MTIECGDARAEILLDALYELGMVKDCVADTSA